MPRAHAAAGLVVGMFLATPTVIAQQSAPAVGPSGPGLQPQINTSPYLPFAAPPAARNVAPLAIPPFNAAFPPVMRFAPRLAPPPPVAFAFAAPAPPGAVANNPGVFNPGVVVLFPLPPGVGAPVNRAAFNPVFARRRGVPSAYYTPPLPPQHAASQSADIGPSLPEFVLTPVTGSADTPAATRGPGSEEVAGLAARLAAPVGDFRLWPWQW